MPSSTDKNYLTVIYHLDIHGYNRDMDPIQQVLAKEGLGELESRIKQLQKSVDNIKDPNKVMISMDNYKLGFHIYPGGNIREILGNFISTAGQPAAILTNDLPKGTDDDVETILNEFGLTRKHNKAVIELPSNPIHKFFFGILVYPLLSDTAVYPLKK